MEAFDFTFFLGLFIVGVLIAYRLATILYTSLLVTGKLNLYPKKEYRNLIKTKVAKNIRSVLSSQNEEQNGGNTPLSFRVFCASERSLAKVMNLFPWESRGILSFDGADIHFSGVRTGQFLFAAKQPKLKVRYRFPRNQVKISFVPSSFLRDGGFEWIKMEAHKHKFYFTCGRKSRIRIGSENYSTLDIYDIISDI